MRETRQSGITAWVATAALFVVAGILFVGSVIPAREGLRRTRARLDAQNAENERLVQRRAHLERQADALEGDPWTIERVLRDDLRMSRDEELIVR